MEQRTDWLYGWLPHFEGRQQQEEEDPRTFGWATGDFATRIARLPDTQREGLLEAPDTARSSRRTRGAAPARRAHRQERAVFDLIGEGLTNRPIGEEAQAELAEDLDQAVRP